MIGLIVGTILAFLSSFVPGLTPISTALLAQLLHLVGMPVEAEIASWTSYLLSSIMASSKEAYAMDLISQIEGSFLDNNAAVANEKRVQSYIAWTKIIMLCTVTPLAYKLSWMPYSISKLPAAASIGFVMLVWIVYKTKLTGLVYIAIFGGMFYLLRDNLYLAFFIGAGYKLIPNILHTANGMEKDSPDLGEDEPNLAEILIFSWIGALGTAFYVLLTQGINPNGVHKFFGTGGTAGAIMRGTQTFVLECMLVGFFLAGSFTGKAGIGMVAKPEYMSVEAVAFVVVIAVVWQLLLSPMSNTYWKHMIRIKGTYNFSKYLSLMIIGVTLAYTGGIVAWGCVAVMVLMPFLFYKLHAKGHSIGPILYVLPMSGNS